MKSLPCLRIIKLVSRRCLLLDLHWVSRIALRPGTGGSAACQRHLTSGLPCSVHGCTWRVFLGHRISKSSYLRRLFSSCVWIRAGKISCAKPRKSRTLWKLLQRAACSKCFRRPTRPWRRFRRVWRTTSRPNGWVSHASISFRTTSCLKFCLRLETPWQYSRICASASMLWLARISKMVHRCKERESPSSC